MITVQLSLEKWEKMLKVYPWIQDILPSKEIFDINVSVFDQALLTRTRIHKEARQVDQVFLIARDGTLVTEIGKNSRYWYTLYIRKRHRKTIQDALVEIKDGAKRVHFVVWVIFRDDLTARQVRKEAIIYKMPTGFRTLGEWWENATNGHGSPTDPQNAA